MDYSVCCTTTRREIDGDAGRKERLSGMPQTDAIAEEGEEQSDRHEEHSSQKRCRSLYMHRTMASGETGLRGIAGLWPDSHATPQGRSLMSAHARSALRALR